MASPIQTLKEFVTPDVGDARQTYVCRACDNRFVSAKRPRRVRCTECLDNDVELLEAEST